MTTVNAQAGQATYRQPQYQQPAYQQPHQQGYHNHQHYYYPQQQRVVPVQAGNISPLDRTIALVMTAGWFFGISGLQRFYAGKIWTGLLWFFTGGLFGIGQLVDVILIATGHFRDSHDRRIKLWTSENFTMFQPHPEHAPPASAGVSAGTGVPVKKKQPRDWKTPAIGFASVGAIMLATVAGFMASMNLTELYQGGAFTGGIDANMQELLGARWPVLGTIILWISSGVGLALGAAGVSLARAKAGVMHVGRSIAAVTMLGASVLLANRGIDAVDMTTVGIRFATDRIPAALEMFFNQVEPAPMIAATLLSVGAVTLMGWPRKETKLIESESKPKVEEGKSEDEVIA